MRDHPWFAAAFGILALALQGLPAFAQVPPDPALAATRQAFEVIRERYVDAPDEAKVILAAIAELDAVAQLSEPLLGARGLGKLPAGAEDKRKRLMVALDTAFKKMREARDLSDDALADSAIKGLVSALDPASSAIEAAKWRDAQAWAKRGSVGLRLAEDRGIRVAEAIEDGPGEAAGVKAGDTIVAIDGAPVIGFPLASVVTRLNGPLDTEVAITVTRAGEAAPITVTMRRASVRLPHVHGRLIDGAAYVAVTDFLPNTAAKLKTELTRLKAEAGAAFRGYLIDLRNTSEGGLDAATAVAGIFVEPMLIATTKARGRDVAQLHGGSLEPLAGDRIVILVNKGTAGGAELVANALKTHRGAVLVGSATAGAGAVQETIGLPDGLGALKLTVARIVLPNGKPLDKNGLKVDFAAEDPRGRDKDQTGPSPALDPRLDAKDRELQAGLKVLAK